VYVWHT